MGVGVYNTSIGNPEIGKTFIVSAPLFDHDEAYEEYLKEMGEEEAVSDQATFLQEQYTQHYEDLVRTIQSSARKFFEQAQELLHEQVLTLPETGTAEDRWAEFDGNFRLAYDFNHLLEVGIRDWEGDHVVGVAMRKDPRDDDPMDHILEHGLSIDDLVDQRLAMGEALSSWLRQSLMRYGFECLYKAGQYLTGTYSSENAEEEMQEALESFARHFADSQRHAGAALADSFERDPHNAISKILDEDLLYVGNWNYHDYPDHVNYVVYDCVSDRIVLIDGDYDLVDKQIVRTYGDDDGSIEAGIRLSDDRLVSEPGAKRYKALSLDNPDNVKLISQIQRELEDKILITPQAYQKSFDVALCREIEFAQDEPTPSP